MSQPPSHWKPTTLGEIIERIEAGRSFAGESRPASLDEWGIIKVSAMTYGTFRENENKAVPAEADFSPVAEIQPGDLLISRANTRDYVGASVLVGNCRPRLLLSDKSLRLHPIGAVDRRWLWYALNTPSARQYLSDASTGVKSGMRNISQASLRAMPLMLPPLDEQRQIVKLLEDHLFRLDAAQSEVDSAVRRINGWRRASADRLLSGLDAPVRSVAELLREPMRNGHSARAARDGEPGIRTLTLTAVTRWSFTDAFTKMSAADPNRVFGLWLAPGDILVQRSNTPELVGTTAMYGGPPNWAIFPDLMIRLRVDTEVALPEYVTAVLRSERVHRQLRSKAKGLAGSMPKIDQQAIASVVLKVPPLSCQRELMSELSEIEQASSRLAQAANTARRQAQALRKALLDAAFSGRLTGRASDMDMVEEMAGV